MSILDKVVAAVMPPESEKARANARAEFSELAGGSPWLSAILKHHLQIEAAFDALEQASTVATRRAAQKWLSIILTGHSIAEEAVVYPAMASNGEKVRAEMGYQEQAAAKGETAALDELNPLGEDYNDKLAHIRGAVEHHMFQEESAWFPKLHRNASAETIQRVTDRYLEEFNRYIGRDTPRSVAAGFSSKVVLARKPVRRSATPRTGQRGKTSSRAKS